MATKNTVKAAKPEVKLSKDMQAVIVCVFKAVSGLAGLFDKQSIYDKAVQAVRGICKGNRTKWQIISDHVDETWLKGNPDPAQKETVKKLEVEAWKSKRNRFRSAKSYFREQCGIKSKGTGPQGPRNPAQDTDTSTDIVGSVGDGRKSIPEYDGGENEESRLNRAVMFLDILADELGLKENPKELLVIVGQAMIEYRTRKVKDTKKA